MTADAPKTASVPSVELLRTRAEALAARMRGRGYTVELREFPADDEFDRLNRFYVIVVLTHVVSALGHGQIPRTVWTQIHERYPYGQKPTCGGGATWDTKGATEVGIAMSDSQKLLRHLRTEAPTEGGTDDDTTGQGSSPGGATAADDDRAGADSREVGVVVSEVPPASEEGGAGVPSAGAPPPRLRGGFLFHEDLVAADDRPGVMTVERQAP